MVDKKGLKAVNRNGLLIIFLVLGAMVFVFAIEINGYNDSLVSGGNYSDDITFNVSTNMNSSAGFNVTCFYNSSGGNAYENMTLNNLTGTVSVSAAATNFTSFTIDTTQFVDSTSYNITCRVDNETSQNLTTGISITIDNTAPRVTNFANTVDGGVYNGSQNITLRVLVNDSVGSDSMRGVGSVYFNITNSTGAQVNWTAAVNESNTGNKRNGLWNASVNISEFVDGVYTITVYANETATDEAYFASNENNSESINITIDNVAPSAVTLTRGTGSSRNTNVITITGVDATSGIDHCSIDSTLSPSSTITGRGSATQTLTQTGLNCGQSYSYIVTCRDYAGHTTVSSSTSFSTSTCGSSSGPSPTVSSIEQINILNLDPESEGSLSNFDEDIGIKEMKISVTEAANDVKVTVRKFDSQPAEITVSKTGNVHKYLQIETENLGSKLKRAILTIKVQKNWLLDNSIDKANIALFKFNEATEEWGELSTIYQNEDGTYYYYDVEVTSFSYFAIAEKVIGEPGEGEEEENLLWLWIVIGIVVVAVIIGGGIAVKKKKK